LLSFFFSSRRRHTRSKRDWSSDVCSSDLTPRLVTRHMHALWASFCLAPPRCLGQENIRILRSRHQVLCIRSIARITDNLACLGKIGRASCRERVWVGGEGGCV